MSEPTFLERLWSGKLIHKRSSSILNAVGVTHKPIIGRLPSINSTEYGSSNDLNVSQVLDTISHQPEITDVNYLYDELAKKNMALEGQTTAIAYLGEKLVEQDIIQKSIHNDLLITKEKEILLKLQVEELMETQTKLTAENSSFRLKVQSLKTQRLKEQDEIKECKAKISELESKLTRSERQGKMWELESQKRQSVIEESNTKYEKLCKTAKDWESCCKEAQTERDNLYQQLADSRSAVESIEAKSLVLEEKNMVGEARMRELEQEIHHLKQQVAQATHDRESISQESKQSIERLEAQLEQNKKNADKFRLEAVQKMKEARAELKQFKADNQSAHNVRNKLESQLKKIEEQHKKELDEKNGNIQELQKRIQQTDETLRKQKTDAENLLKQKKQKFDEIKNLVLTEKQKRVEETEKANLLAEEIKKLKEENRKLLKKQTDLQNENNKIVKVYLFDQDLQEKTQTLKQKYLDETMALQKSIDEKDALVDELHKSYNSQILSIQEEHDKKMEELQNEMENLATSENELKDTLNSDILQLQGTLEALTYTNEEKTLLIESQEQQLLEIREEYEKLVKELDNIEFRLAQELRSKAELNEKMFQISENYRNEYKETQNQLQEFAAKITSAQVDINELLGELLASKERELSGMKTNVEDLNEKLLEAEKENSGLRTSLDSLQKSFESLESTFIALNLEKDTLNQELQEQSKLREVSEGRVKELECLNVESIKENSSLREKLDFMHLEVRRICVALESMNKQREADQAIIERQSKIIADHFSFLADILKGLNPISFAAFDGLTIDDGPPNYLTREIHLFALLQKSVADEIGNIGCTLPTARQVGVDCSNIACRKIVQKSISENAVLNSKVIKYQNCLRRLSAIVGDTKQNLPLDNDKDPSKLRQIVKSLTKRPQQNLVASKQLWESLRKRLWVVKALKSSTHEQPSWLKDLELLKDSHIALVESERVSEVAKIWQRILDQVNSLSSKPRPATKLRQEDDYNVLRCLRFLENIFGLKDFDSIQNRVASLVQKIHRLIMKVDMLENTNRVLLEDVEERDMFIEEQLHRITGD